MNFPWQGSSSIAIFQIICYIRVLRLPFITDFDLPLSAWSWDVMGFQAMSQGKNRNHDKTGNKIEQNRKHDCNIFKFTGRPRIWYQVLPVFFYFFFRW
jgi:hypothetical protein